LCAGAGVMVAAVDYALAPEHKFPAGLEDSRRAIRWAAQNAESLGADGARLMLGGDSAGATLALAGAMGFRADGPAISALFHAYPVVAAPAYRRHSYAQYGTGYGLTGKTMEWFLDHYLAASEHAQDPDACPLLHASF